MSVYLTMIFVTIIFSAFAVGSLKNVNGVLTKDKPSIFFVFSILLLWCTVYALRYRVGTDFGNYYNYFNRIVSENLTLTETLQNQRDFLFGCISYCSAKIFNGKWVGFAYVCAFFTYFPVLYVIQKKSKHFVASVLFYIFTLSYFSGFNGVRQAIAIAMISLAYYCGLKEKKYWFYIVFTLLAFGFHSTVFIIVPFQLLSMVNIKSKSFKITIVLLLFSYIFLWDIWSVVIEFLETIGQGKLASDYSELAENGSSIIRLIVSIIPPMLGIIYRKNLRKNYEDVDSEIILLCFAAIFSLFSLKNWIFSRIAGYCDVVLIMFLPKLGCIFSERSKNLGRLLILLLYFLYMISLLLHGGGHLLPYRFLDM